MTTLAPQPGAGDRPLCVLAGGLAGTAQPEQVAALLLGQGSILALGPQALAAAAPRLELPGLWLSPAPMDTHVHLYLGGSPPENLAATLAAGVAAVRDLGNMPSKPIPSGQGQAPPWVVSSGPGLGPDGEGACWLAHRLRGPEQFRAAARQRASQGAPLLKIFATGLLDFEHPGQVLAPQAVSLEEMRAVTEVGREAGLPVAAHASGAAAVRLALAAGVDCLEHGYFLDQPTLAQMARQGMAWAPTVAAIKAHAQDRQGRHAPRVRDNLWRIYAGQLAAMAMAEALGVEFAFGTDAGSYELPHGAAVAMEIACWQEAGLRPQTIYQAATRRAARLMGLEGRLGVLAPGAKDWVVALDADPALHPAALGRIRWRSF